MPTRANLLELARDAGLKPAFARQAIERIASVAADFTDHAKGWKIRRTTLASIASHIDKNLAALRQ